MRPEVIDRLADAGAGHLQSRGGFLGGPQRAAQGTATDPALAPCFPMYNASHDCGVAGHPCFGRRQLLGMKVNRQPHCFSTLNHNLAYCYDASRAIRWVLKQAVRGVPRNHRQLRGLVHADLRRDSTIAPHKILR
jgi:hypothetical protein